MMLKSGKHVLCEKPMAMNQREVEEVLTVAKETKKFFMEVLNVVFLSANTLHTRHSPGNNSMSLGYS